MDARRNLMVVRARMRPLHGMAIGVLISALGLAACGDATSAPRPSGGAPLSIGDPAYRDCIFDRAGMAHGVQGLDQLDRDMMFLAAARDTSASFVARKTETDPPHPYARLFSPAQADRLQALVKARAVCRTTTGQVLQPWPLESDAAP